MEHKYARTHLWLQYIGDNNRLACPFNLLPSFTTCKKVITSSKCWMSADNIEKKKVETTYKTLGREQKHIACFIHINTPPCWLFTPLHRCRRVKTMNQLLWFIDVNTPSCCLNDPNLIWSYLPVPIYLKYFLMKHWFSFLKSICIAFSIANLF